MVEHWVGSKAVQRVGLKAGHWAAQKVAHLADQTAGSKVVR